MPTEGELPVTAVRLVPAGGELSTDEGLAGRDSPRRRWWLIVAVVVALAAAAIGVSVQTGSDSLRHEEEASGDDASALDGIGQAVDVCLGLATAERTRLFLPFASTKPEGVDQLSWSPDCQRMVFRVGSTLWAADGDGTGDEPFLTAPHGLSTPTWSPDSERIAFSRNAVVNGERASHIYVVGPDALGLRQVTDGLVLDRDPTWSPDGTRIAFSRRVHATDGPGAGGFDQHLVVVDLATGASQALLAGGERESEPSWSPDGELIAYRVDDAAKLLRVADGAVSELLNADVGGKPTWSPDSARVAAWRQWTVDSATIIISDLPGRDFGGQQVIALAGLDETSPRVMPTLRWSSDGRRLVFHVVESENVSWVYSGSVP